MKPDLVDELFVQYYNDALLYTISLCRHKQMAEDIVSAAFYKALASSDNNITNFKAWLFTVCRNEFISVYRKNKRLSFDEIPEDTVDDCESTIDKIIRSEEYRALYRAIDLLTKDQREIITLFYFSDMKIKDIATVTGKSENNIKILLYRGREKLKQLMEEKL